jgi:hypothetical protein
VSALPVFLYWSESWTVTAKDIHKIQSLEMGYLRSVRGCARLYQITMKMLGKNWQYSGHEKNTLV